MQEVAAEFLFYFIYLFIIIIIFGEEQKIYISKTRMRLARHPNKTEKCLTRVYNYTKTFWKSFYLSAQSVEKHPKPLLQEHSQGTPPPPPGQNPSQYRWMQKMERTLSSP